MANKVLEKTVVAAIKRRLKKLPSMKVRKRRGGMANAGEVDLYGSLRAIHFEIEVKAPGGKPTPLQLEKLREWKDAGAIVGVAWSAEDAVKILKDGLEDLLLKYQANILNALEDLKK